MIGLFVYLVLLASLDSLYAATRSIHLRNSCGYPVRVGFTAGAIPGSSCTSNSGCPSNGICSTETSMCYYPSFMPEGYLDLTSGSNQSLSVNVNYGDLYSGAVFVSTGCETYSNACETGICKNKHCGLNTGAVGPHTRAEFTFDPKSVDFYDISIMHGANVPISMSPTNGNKVQGNPYSCGSAGATRSIDGMPRCSYAYNPIVNGQDQTSNIVFVASQDLNNLQFCNSDSECNGSTCGLAAGRDPTGLPTQEVQRVCGKAVGIWSMDEVCVYSNGGYDAAPYTCNRALQYGTYTNLYGCSGAYVSSGYQPGQPVDKVCGCYDWESSPAGTEQCISANPDWLRIAYPWARLLKDMCPLAYSYAYDDMSSTFTCAGTGDGSLAYDIEFCPGGVDISKA